MVSSNLLEWYNCGFPGFGPNTTITFTLNLERGTAWEGCLLASVDFNEPRVLFEGLLHLLDELGGHWFKPFVAIENRYIGEDQFPKRDSVQLIDIRQGAQLPNV